MQRKHTINYLNLYCNCFGLMHSVSIITVKHTWIGFGHIIEYSIHNYLMEFNNFVHSNVINRQLTCGN